VQNVLNVCNCKDDVLCRVARFFFGTTYQNGGKYTKLPQNIPNGYTIFPMAIK
jgi:hypothetical protein